VIGAGIAHNCKMAVSKIAIDGGHFILSWTSGAGIGTASAMANLHLDVSSSSVGEIHMKGSSFRILGDEGRTGTSFSATLKQIEKYQFQI
jgi:hypothetical protein